MIRFFKSPQPATMIIIPIIVLVFWARTFLKIAPVTSTDDLPLWKMIASFLLTLPAWVNFIILYGFICLEAIYFNIMLNRHEVIYKNTFIPALIFVFFISFTPVFMNFSPVHIVNLLLIRVFDRLFTLYKNELPVSALFDTGFLCGLSALLYFPASVLILLLISAMAVLRPFRLKEWLILLIGFFLPYFFVCTWMFWNHELLNFWQTYLNRFRSIHPFIVIEKNPALIVTGIGTGILLILSLFKLRINYRKNVIRTRSFQQIFFIFLLLAFGSFSLLKQIKLIDMVFLLIPFSVFCGYYFVSAKKRVWLYEYALWGMIGLIIWNHLI